MRERCRPCRRVPSFEELESRTLLAGNVLATLDFTGLLRLTGDDRPNSVLIVADGTSIRVSGEGGTTINGASTALSRPAASVKSIDISMAKGNDTVAMLARPTTGFVGFDLTGNLRVITGAGNDKVIMIVQNGRFATGFEIDGSLLINTGSDNDEVMLRAQNRESNGFSAAALNITTGAGRDLVRLGAVNRDNSFSGFSGFVFGSAFINSSNNNSSVVILDARNESGIGFKILDALSIQTGAFNDDVRLLGQQRTGQAFLLRGSLSIATGAGLDQVTISARNAFSFDFGSTQITIDGSGDFDRLTDTIFHGPDAIIRNFEAIVRK